MDYELKIVGGTIVDGSSGPGDGLPGRMLRGGRAA
jgi:hypothetical protein|tara:strand:+ start:325 stop:429 length:105 start_codon:yes stop_codon:yes gene_type:complete